MFEQADQRLEPALRNALEEATAPSVSAGFDAAVLAGVSRRRAPWAALRSLRPALAAGLCSFALGVLLLRWFTALPVPPAFGAASERVLAARPASTPNESFGGSVARMLAERLALLHASGVGGDGFTQGDPDRG